jgi:hypothetical protein
MGATLSRRFALGADAALAAAPPLAQIPVRPNLALGIPLCCVPSFGGYTDRRGLPVMAACTA